MKICFLANKRFSNPLVQCSKISFWDGSYYRMGYYTFGPIFFAFVLWMLKRSKEQGIEILLLILNDGYIIKGILDIIKETGKFELPKYQEIYANRSLSLYYHLGNSSYESFNLGQDVRKITIKIFLRQFIDDDKAYKDINIKCINNGINTDSLYLRGSFNDELYKVFNLLSNNDYIKHIRLSIKGYINQFKDSNVGVVDVGYRGIGQHLIQSIWEDKNLRGFYFLAYGKSYVPPNDRNDFVSTEIFSDISDYRDLTRLIEIAMSKCTGSLKYLVQGQDSYNYHFTNYKYSAQHLENINALQKGIFDFVKEISNELEFVLPEFNVSAGFVTRYYKYLLSVGKQDELTFTMGELADSDIISFTLRNRVSIKSSHNILQKLQNYADSRVRLDVKILFRLKAYRKLISMVLLRLIHIFKIR